MANIFILGNRMNSG